MTYFITNSMTHSYANEKLKLKTVNVNDSFYN